MITNCKLVWCHGHACVAMQAFSRTTLMPTASVGMAPAIKFCLAATRMGVLTALIAALCNAAFAGSGEAVGKVQEGIALFQGGDFKAAAEAFSAADEALPNELKIAFDRGCAYAAGGEYDKSIEQLQKAAAAPDRKLAALAQYNLGSVAVAKAKAQLGDKPEDAEDDARTTSLELLVQAAKHYHDCLNTDPANSDARYNLETIRLWVKHIQDVWKKRDQQKRRDAMNLLEYLVWLEGEQRSLLQLNKELGSANASPRQREVVRAAENAQRSLAEEIEPLKQKIASTLSAPPQQPGQNAAASPSADVQKAIEVLSHMADEVRQSMDKAAGSLADQSLPEAAGSQSQAVETIDQIFMAVSPFANLVQRGIGRQEELINQSPSAEKQDKTDDKNTSANPARSQNLPAKFDGNEAAWNQRFVARYGRILSAKARRELEQLNSMPADKQDPAAQTATSPTPDANATATPDKDQAGSDEHLTAQQQRRDLKEALQLGVESAPKVEKLADEAALLLEEDKPDEALPKQQEALKLLKDMLPKQQQQEKDKKDQDKKDQEKKDQQKKDQDKKDQNKKDQDKKDQDKKDQQNKDQNKKDQNKPDQQKKDEKDQQQDKQQSKRDLNKEQAEAVLHKARQRQDQHRELEKTLEGYLYRPEKVDKDW
jgi:hypothetical protein